LKVVDHKYLEGVSMRVRIDSRVFMSSFQNQDTIRKILIRKNKITLKYLKM